MLIEFSALFQLWLRPHQALSISVCLGTFSRGKRGDYHL